MGARRPREQPAVVPSPARTTDPACTAGARRGAGRPGVLLDRDGTIIVDGGHVGSVERVVLLDGAAAAIARLNRAGIPVVVVSNQAGVARGLYSLDDVERVHAHIAGELAAWGASVDRFYYCPYHPDGVVAPFARHSEDRKPGPGMALAAAAELDLDLASSWVVGDRQEDVALAVAVGATPVYLGAGPSPVHGVPRFASLAGAASWILEEVAA